MLAKIVILPSALDVSDSALPAVGTTMLQDFEEAGQILADRASWVSYETHLDSWPPAMRTHARKRLAAMRHRGRVAWYKVPEAPSRCSCEYLYGLGKQLSAQFVFCNDECCDHAPASTAVIRTPDYPISAYRDWVLESRSLVVDAGRTLQTDLVDQVLGPVLEFAKRVALIDRNIGRSSVGRNFRDTIMWMAGVYNDIGRKDERLMRIVTSIEPHASADVAEAAMGQFQRELAAAYPSLTFEIELYRDRPSVEMTHERYLVTNQVALSIGRGFDLLGPRSGRVREIKDVNINRLSTSPDVIESSQSRPLGTPIAVYGRAPAE